MKKAILFSIFIIAIISFNLFSLNYAEARSYRTKSSDVQVKGYFRKNGTYVKPYYRSKADNSISNNYSCIDSGICGNATTKPAYNTPTVGTNSNNTGVVRTNVESIKANPAIVPVNAHVDYFGTGWTCDKGYYRAGGGCLQVAVPENAHLDYWGTGWLCDKGFSRTGNGCQLVVIPSNAHLDYFGTDWICDRGYYRAGGGCLQVAVPENAHLDYWGTGWLCEKGYYRAGVGCQQVIIPANAHLDYWGTGWLCDSGYMRIGYECQ